MKKQQPHQIKNVIADSDENEPRDRHSKKKASKENAKADTTWGRQHRA